MMNNKDQAQNPKEAYIYCRVSTGKQVTDGNGLEGQRINCEKYCAEKGYKVLGCFEDDGIGGDTEIEKRPGLLALFKAAGKKKIVIVAYSLSRITRDNFITASFYVMVEKMGYGVETVTETFDDSPSGKFMRNVLSSVYQFEREMNRDRVISKMKAQLSKGRRMYGPPPAWYKSENRTITPREPNATIVRNLYEKVVSYELSRSSKDVITFLVKKGFTNKQGHVTRPTPHILESLFDERIIMEAAGFLLYENEWIPAQHQAIISPELARQVIARLNDGKNRVYRGGLSEQFPLRGFISCAECGQRLTASSPNKSNTYGYYYCINPECSFKHKSTRTEIVHEHFADLLKRACPTDKVLKATLDILRINWKGRLAEAQEDRMRSQRRLKACQEEIQRFLAEVPTAPSQAIKNALYREIERREEEGKAIEASLGARTLHETDFEKVLSLVTDFLRNPARAWLEGDAGTKRMVQRLVFADQLRYVPRTEFRNPDYALPFAVFEESNREIGEMVEYCT